MTRPLLLRSLLAQSLLGHLDLLAERHPKKAATTVARRARRHAQASLKLSPPARATPAPARRAA